MGMHFFLGANSADGFAGYYDRLTGGALRDLLILKGGPGSGKSTLMQRIAQEMERRGELVAYIHCSGDPQSLDGVYFPRLHAAAVDGTAPHVVEPTYTGAAERYCDLGRFCDFAGAKAQRGAIVARSDAYRAAYRRAYQALRALAAVEDERRSLVRAVFPGQKFLSRAAGIAARELRGGGSSGGQEYAAFLGGFTHEGALCRFDTVDTLCTRVYALCDGYGLARPMLELWRAAARSLGETVVACFDPLRPGCLRHLLLPGRSLAFVTVDEHAPYAGKPARRIRLDAAAHDALGRAERAKLRFTRRICRALEEEAVDALREAKAEHDALEAIYRPLMDFSAVSALADEEAARFAAHTQG